MNIQDKFIDFHIHSVFSDGTWTPEEIAENIKAAGLGIFSITDHDTVKGVLEGQGFAKERQVGYIRGVEVSCTLNQDWEHVLAYGVDINNVEFNELLKENREKIVKKDFLVIRHLEGAGYPVSLEDFTNYEYDKRRGGFKALNYLIDKNLCKNVRGFFSKFSEIPEVSGFPTYRDISEVVGIIKAAGGLPVIAHPFYTKAIPNDVDQRLKAFLEVGIEGIECFHPSHDVRVANDCMRFCKNNKLAMSVGSDCHGSFAPNRKIGMHSVQVKDISLGKLKDYIIF